MKLEKQNLESIYVEEKVEFKNRLSKKLNKQFAGKTFVLRYIEGGTQYRYEIKGKILSINIVERLDNYYNEMERHLHIDYVDILSTETKVFDEKTDSICQFFYSTRPEECLLEAECTDWEGN